MTNRLWMSGLERIQLFEAVAVDDFFQLAVVVVVQGGLETSDFHQFAILLSVGMPSVLSVAVGVACMGKLCPYITYPCGSDLIGIKG